MKLITWAQEPKMYKLLNTLKKLFGIRKEDPSKEQAQSAGNDADLKKMPPLPTPLVRSRNSNVNGWIRLLLASILLLQAVELIASPHLAQWVKHWGDGANKMVSSLFSKPAQVSETTGGTTLATPPSVAAPSVEFQNLPESIYAGDEIKIIAEVANIDSANVEFLETLGDAETLIPSNKYSIEGNTIAFIIVLMPATESMTLIARARDTGQQIIESRQIKILMPYRISVSVSPYPDIDQQNSALIADFQAQIILKVEHKLPNENTWIAQQGATGLLASNPKVSPSQGSNFTLDTAGNIPFTADAEGNILLLVDLTGVTSTEIVFKVKLPQYGVANESRMNVIVPTILQPMGTFDLLKLDDPSKTMLRGVSSLAWLKFYSIGDIEIEGKKYIVVLVTGGKVKQEYWGKSDRPTTDNGLTPDGYDVVRFGDGALGMWNQQIFLVGDLMDPPSGYAEVKVIGLVPAP